MLGSAAQDAFIGRSVIAIVTTVRADGAPSSSMIAFARRDDRIYFTTTTSRWKGRMLARDARCTLAVLNPHEPWSYVAVDGMVVVHYDNPAELRALLLSAADHPDYAWSRSEAEAMMSAPERAVYELVPGRVSGVVFPPSS